MCGGGGGGAGSSTVALQMQTPQAILWLKMFPTRGLLVFYCMAAHPESVAPDIPSAMGLLSVSRPFGWRAWSSPKLWSLK